MVFANTVIAVFLCLFTVWQVNHPTLRPQSNLAAFAMCGLVLAFLNYPLHPRWKTKLWSKLIDVTLAVVSAICLLYVISQFEPAFKSLWLTGQTLGDRAANEQSWDIVVAIVLIVLVLEATRRCMGLALPILAMAFLVYAYFGQQMPEWLLPHRGYSLERIAAQTGLQGQGMFGTALGVMFQYVFLFVVFGAFLGATGATEFIIEFCQKLFRKSAGAPAKMAVVSSGLMGSLSGSAVANVVTTGTFTIPLMKASGFRPAIAGGIEAASSSGGALMPPVMGAAAYLMLEIVQPTPTYLEICKAALIPAILYYLSLFLFVHFHSRKLAMEGTIRAADNGTKAAEREVVLEPYKGVLFFGSLVVLVALMAMGLTPTRAVTAALLVIIFMSLFRKETRLSWRSLVDALRSSGREAVPLVCAAACVGIIIGVVQMTGVGSKLPALIMAHAENNLFGALVLIMIASLILGMGLPSVVCYLLLATLVGDVLGKLGVVPLAAHMFIFYFGMMSMVTPPVALAGYAAASIAGSGIMITSWWAFRVALVGFTLPFMFVFRPELLLLAPPNETLSVMRVIYVVTVAAGGVLAFAAALSGFMFRGMQWGERILMFVAAAIMLYPAKSLVIHHDYISDHDLAGLVLLGVLTFWNWRRGRHVPVTA
jgi:TRAP transporter 4TM/12TM fusion protein